MTTPLVSLFILLAKPAGAFPVDALKAVHSDRVTYCEYFSSDQICGGKETIALNKDQNEARERINLALKKISNSVLDSSDYTDQLRALNQTYASADAATKTTLQLLALNLNQTWLNRYQPRIENWLSEAPAAMADRFSAGWLAYGAAFGAAPHLSNVPLFQKFIAARLPWTFLAAGIGAASAYYGYQAIKAKAPAVPPPPVTILNFIDSENPSNDVEAQREFAEFSQKQTAIGNTTNFGVVFASGTAGIAEITGLTRFAFLGRMALAVRVTPLSLAAGFALGEMASWTYSIIHARQLKGQFLAVDDESPAAGQELSIALNGLHFLYLADADKNEQATDKFLQTLFDEDKTDDDLRYDFSARVESDAFLRAVKQIPMGGNAHVFAAQLRATYSNLATETEQFKNYLLTFKNLTPLKAGIIQRRVALLDSQETELNKLAADFPTAKVEAKLLQIYQRKGGVHVKM